MAFAGRNHKAPFGTLVLETMHETEGSRNIEIDAFKTRMNRGEIGYIEVISHIRPYGIERLYK